MSLRSTQVPGRSAFAHILLCTVCHIDTGSDYRVYSHQSSNNSQNDTMTWLFLVVQYMLFLLNMQHQDQRQCTNYIVQLVTSINPSCRSPHAFRLQRCYTYKSKFHQFYYTSIRIRKSSHATMREMIDVCVQCTVDRRAECGETRFYHSGSCAHVTLLHKLPRWTRH